ncbi:MAG: c-type cytochrome [Gammaproteobacteria bacterium]|nr:c-type cytochrome [Gammaproteobacteria bacterium]
MSSHVLYLRAVALGLVICSGCAAAQELDEPILPLPLTVELDPARVALGEKLFNDPRLAHNNAMACASCHQLEQGGDDGLPRSITNSGEPDVINTPGIFNRAFNFRQTWGGAFRTLEEQAEAALHNPRHAATTWEELLPKLAADAQYAASFSRIYGGVRKEHVLDAIATYERSLITPNAPFDRYLRGDARAISAEQKHGYELFKSYGCISCHQGVNVGGNLFQKFGLFEDYFKLRGGPLMPADLGRYNVTKDERDRHVFRVPSLRNIAVTAPYFHDGSVEKLGYAVEVMARVQLGRKPPPHEVQAIVSFLESLTGEYQGRTLAAPRSTP